MIVMSWILFVVALVMALCLPAERPAPVAQTLLIVAMLVVVVVLQELARG
jgi:hypothetical protein